jgi:putative SOS response-associated peptidase YedK
MCGRYDLSTNPAAIRAKFAVPSVPDLAANADLRPTNTGLVVRLNVDGARECVGLRWGLIPFWSKDAKIGNTLFNARAETLAMKSAFREAFRRRRCLVVASAFYEWAGVPGHKIKHRISLPESPLMAMAGVWEHWRDPADGREIRTFTIATCEPNLQMQAIHNRMPVILPSDALDVWLREASIAPLAPYAGALNIEPPPPGTHS